MSASSVKPLNVQLPAITLILFALCVGIFCYLAQWMSYEEVDQSALIHLGANVASLTLSGESWRLLSSVFLHSSVSHLLMNMFALLVVGGAVERILGKWRLLIIWLFSGIFGGLISACYALRESEQIVISTAAKPNSAVSTHSGQLPVRAYGVSPVVGVTLVVNTSRVNCGIIA